MTPSCRTCSILFQTRAPRGTAARPSRSWDHGCSAQLTRVKRAPRRSWWPPVCCTTSGTCSRNATKRRSRADDAHQLVAQSFLRGLFSEAVLAPIRMHVDAKRYLCTTEPGYWVSLSPASKASLELQGGAFSPRLAERFIQLEHAPTRLHFGAGTHLAKTPGALVPGLRSFADLLEKIRLR